MAFVEIKIPNSAMQFLSSIPRYLYDMGGTDQRRPLEKAGQYMLNKFAERIERQGGSGYWKGLEKSTRDQRSYQGYGSERPIFIRKGSLLKAAGQKKWRGTSYRGTDVKNVWEMTNTPFVGGRTIPRWELLVGVESDYIRSLNYGNRGRNIAARPFIYADRTDEVYIKNIYKEWMTEVVDRINQRRGNANP